jgi:SWI/SNF-related matrix-associated actin-dependent regulator 1 of chromatin subfamily A
MLSNRYPGKCTCGRYVPADAGSAVKRNGYWTVQCASCTIERESVPVRSALSADGTVTMAYNPEALPILRGAPGARWIADQKVWHWSVSDTDLPRTLECADRLRLEVAPELHARLAAGTTETRAASDRIEAAEALTAMRLYPFQRVGVDHLARHSRALLADDMGLGKTVQVCVALDNQGAVVVCPASLLRVWEGELRRWRPDLTPVILRGRKALRAPLAGEVVIVSYETAATSESVDTPTLVVDEAHACKSYKAKRSKAILALVKCAKRAWFLTGTPLLGRPQDLYGVLESLDSTREVFGSWRRFVELMGGAKDHWGGWTWGEPRSDVPERLRRVMLRRTKSEVLPDLPSKIRSYRYCETAREAQAELADFDRDWGESIRKGRLPPFSEIARCRAVLAESRISDMMTVVEEYSETETPLLVFSAHRAPVDALSSREGWSVITGDTSLDERAQIVEQFQAGKLQGVALTIQAGGLGLTLTRASHVLFVDRHWTPALNLQAEDRVCRIGQRAQSIQVTVLVDDSPIERRVSELLEEKITLIEQAIERTAPSVTTTAEERRAELEKLAAEQMKEAERIEREHAAETIERRSEGLKRRTNGHSGRRLRFCAAFVMAP